MTCGTCRHQFCWLCRGDYGPNHFAAFNPFGCPGGQFAAEDPDSCFRPGPCGMFTLRLLLFPLVLVAFFAAPMIAGPIALVFGTLAVTCSFFFAMRHCDASEWCEEFSEVTHACCMYTGVGSIISCYLLVEGFNCDDD